MNKTLILCLATAALVAPVLAGSPADRAVVDSQIAAGQVPGIASYDLDLAARNFCVDGTDGQPSSTIAITFTLDEECCDWELSSCGSDETDTYFQSLIGDNGVDYSGWDDPAVCPRDCGPFAPDVLSPAYGTDNNTGGAIPQCLPAGTYVLTVYFYSSYDPATCDQLQADFPWEVCGDFRCGGAASATELPSAFALAQNYPNPFNPTTTIDFSVEATSDVRLTVSNLSGETVATLVDGTVESGAHSVQFDAARLTSGVYFYTLASAGASETRKMVLVK